MSSIVGDTTELNQTRIAFNAVHTVTGAEGHGHFHLTAARGFSHLTSARASVRLLPGSLKCQVIGPAAPDKAVDAYIAVLPASAPEWPSQAAEILTIGGSAFTQHSLYVGAQVTDLGFSQDVAHQLKPLPLVGHPPVIVYCYNVTGGTARSVAHLRVSGFLEVSGIGYVQPW